MANVVPLANIRLRNLAESPSVSSLIAGNNLEEQIEYMHTLDPVQFNQTLNKALSRISGNLQLQRQFLSALVSYSDSDVVLSGLGNLISVVALIGGALYLLRRLSLRPYLPLQRLNSRLHSTDKQKMTSRLEMALSSESRHTVAVTVIAAIVLVLAWSLRFETLSLEGLPFHRNRLTGVVCYIGEECWLTSDAPSTLMRP
jgi:hypothetical protein